MLQLMVDNIMSKVLDTAHYNQTSTIFEKNWVPFYINYVYYIRIQCQIVLCTSEKNNIKGNEEVLLFLTKIDLL